MTQNTPLPLTLLKKSKNFFKNYLCLYCTGFIIGLADLIPGVSGGTIAFLAGIYEELLHSIKLVSDEVLRLLLRGKIREALRRIPFKFLVPLLLGLASALFWLLYSVFVE